MLQRKTRTKRLIHLKTGGRFGLACLILIFGACGSGSSTQPVDRTVIAAVEFGAVVTSSRGFDTVTVAWPSESATLRGTLWMPAGQGPFPAMIMHFGSNEWTRFDISFRLVEPWLDHGIAILLYDKRGVGGSGGTCCDVFDPDYFPLLATDLIEGIRAIGSHADIDSLRVGLYGFSQGGWIVPNAAARSPSVAFTVIGSGPTVSLGEELLYSDLTGDNDCVASGLSEDEIDARLAAAGPTRFDPRSDLEMYTVPGFWFYGGRDTSVPVRQSVAILEDIRLNYGKDFAHIIFPTANHSMIRGGAICSQSGRDEDYFTPVFAWLDPILFGS